MKRIVVALGTRPEAIKLAPVVFALRQVPAFDVCVLLTGQHREQLDMALAVFGIEPDVDLNVMLARQTLPELSSRVITGFAEASRALQPDYVVVHGDTLSAFCVAYAAFLERLPVAHVEAGLRSGVIDEPFPEEASRRLTDLLCDLLLAPTPLARQNLLSQGIQRDRVVTTGQTVVDAIRMAAGRAVLPARWRHRSLVTVTLHRRENWPLLASIASAIARVAADHPDRLFVYPIHMNPVVREAVIPALSGLPNVELIEPLDYGEMAALMAASSLIVTDSGGMIEEGVSLGVFVSVVRNVTERPEGIDAGAAELIGTEQSRVEDGLRRRLAWLEHRPPAWSAGENPYGDGKAAERVAAAIAWRLGHGPRPVEWDPHGGT